jgi:Ca2+-binding EF-hand superfamily protein
MERTQEEINDPFGAPRRAPAEAAFEGEDEEEEEDMPSLAAEKGGRVSSAREAPPRGKASEIRDTFDPSEEEKAEIREAFDLFDTNGDGQIDRKTVKSVMDSLRLEDKFKDSSTIDQMIRKVGGGGAGDGGRRGKAAAARRSRADSDEEAVSGSMNFEEFLDMMTPTVGYRKPHAPLPLPAHHTPLTAVDPHTPPPPQSPDKGSREYISKVFNLFVDDDRTDRISLSNLKRVAKEVEQVLGEAVTEDELNEIIKRADTNQTNEISLEDFIAFLSQPHNRGSSGGGKAKAEDLLEKERSSSEESEDGGGMDMMGGGFL